MKAMFNCLAASVLIFACAPLVGATTAPWPNPLSRMDLATPYGTLHIQTSEYVYESRLRIDDTDIDPKISGILNIPYAFSLPAAQAALVSISTGNDACPVTYRWVILKKTGYKVSPEFGSCSDKIKVSATGRRFTLQTPNTQKPDKIDVYVYDGQTLRRRIAP